MKFSKQPRFVYCQNMSLFGRSILKNGLISHCFEIKYSIYISCAMIKVLYSHCQIVMRSE